VAKKTAPDVKTLGGRTAFTDEQVAHIKSKILELIHQGWTIRQVLAEPDVCSLTYLYRDMLPHDEDLSKQEWLALLDNRCRSIAKFCYGLRNLMGAVRQTNENTYAVLGACPEFP
jgi:hypothetical protein